MELVMRMKRQYMETCIDFDLHLQSQKVENEKS